MGQCIWYSSQKSKYPLYVVVGEDAFYAFLIQVGFIMEEHLDANGVMQQTNRYQPRVDPRDEESDYLPINIDRITGMSNIDTVLSAKSNSDVMFCLLHYQGLLIDRSLVY